MNDLEFLQELSKPISQRLKEKPKPGMCSDRLNLLYCEYKKGHKGRHKCFGRSWD